MKELEAIHRAILPLKTEENVDTPKAGCYGIANSMPALSPALKRLLYLGVILAAPCFTQAQNLTPSGGEYNAGGSWPGDQTAPAVAVGSGGGLLVYQDNNIDGRGIGISGIRLDSSWQPQGARVQINRASEGNQERPAVTMLQDGGAAVAWQGGRGSAPNVYIRFLSASGSFASSDTLLSGPLARGKSTITTNVLYYRNNKAKMKRVRIRQNFEASRLYTGDPAITTLADGSVVVAYGSYRSLITNESVVALQTKIVGLRVLTNTVLVPVRNTLELAQDVYLQRFTSSGRLIDREARANGTTLFNQRNATVAPLPDGGFVICWVSENQGLSQSQLDRGAQRSDIYGRIFNANGDPVGQEFRINTADRPVGNPAAAGLTDGFRVVWTQKDPDRNTARDIYTRSFSAGGAAQSDAVRANTFAFGDQYAPRIASSGNRAFLIWSSLGQDGSSEGVYARLFSGANAAGNEVRVNTTTLYRQQQPAVAGDGAGNFVGVWSSLKRNNGYDVFGQRFSITQ